MDQIADLAKSDRLYLIVKEFAAVDLHPNVVSGHDMGYMFEELIRKFAESDSTQAGDHFTPREVIELMVDILFLTQGEVRQSGSSCGRGRHYLSDSAAPLSGRVGGHAVHPAATLLRRATGFGLSGPPSESTPPETRPGPR